MEQNEKPKGRNFKNIFVEVEKDFGQTETIALRDLPIVEYEEFLDAMHKLRLAYIAVTTDRL